MQFSPNFTLESLLRLRPFGLDEPEIWALLCQSTQALQDFFLNSGSYKSRPAITPGMIKFTRHGRVEFLLGEPLMYDNIDKFLAPEYFRYEDEDKCVYSEKMWIFSVGETMKSCCGASNNEISANLTNVLMRMTDQDVISRATLMNLLDIMTSYYKCHSNKPSCQILTDLYLEIKNHYDKRKIKHRITSRLYVNKYNQTEKSTGPEFILNSLLPWKHYYLHQNGEKNIILTLLTGQKVKVTCASFSTIQDILQLVSEKEGFDSSVTISTGLCKLLGGDFLFLSGDTKLRKVEEENLYMRIKFYPPPMIEITDFFEGGVGEHFLYLQLRKSILEHQIPCSFNEILRLSSLALQVEFGDNNLLTDINFSLEHYIPDTMLSLNNDRHDLTKKLLQSYQLHRGLPKKAAETEFIKLCQQLPHYGGHFYSAQLKNDIDIWLYVNIDGVRIFERHERNYQHFGLSLLHSYDWKQIHTLSYTERQLSITPYMKEKKIKLRFDMKKSIFIFDLISEHHKFFMRMRSNRKYLKDIANWSEQLKGKEQLENDENFLKFSTIQRRVGVRMGTKAIYGRGLDEEPLLLFENSNALLPDFQETVNETLVKKLNEISFENERDMCTVRLCRNNHGSLGLQIIEGSDGNVYVESVNSSGIAYDSNLIRRADQIIAVNGRSLLGRSYEESLQILKNTAKWVELVVARPISMLTSSTMAEPQCRVLELIPKKTNFVGGRRWKGPMRYPVTPIKSIASSLPDSNKEEFL